MLKLAKASLHIRETSWSQICDMPAKVNMSPRKEVCTVLVTALLAIAEPSKHGPASFKAFTRLSSLLALLRIGDLRVAVLAKEASARKVIICSLKN